MTSYRRIGSVRSTLRSHRAAIVGALVFLTGHQVGELAIPVVLGAAIDRAVGSGSVPVLLFWLAVLAADFVVLSLSWRFSGRFGVRVRLGVAADLRLAVAA